MRYAIKPCAESDIDYIWEKFSEAYESLVPSERDSEEERLVLKSTNAMNAIIGGCVLSIDTSKNAEFERLWVDERYRRRGLGSALIHEAELASKAMGCHAMINAYCFDFQNAKPLFEKLGYELIGIAKDWPKGHEGYTLIKQLDDSSETLAQTDFQISRGSEEDRIVIANYLEAYNNSIVPRTHPYLDLDKKIVDEEGRLIAGCIAGVSGWDTAHIDLIWVDESYRNQGIGSLLLDTMETEAKANGAYLARLDTIFIQAPFFIKNGYSVSVVYEDYPKWYVMQKPL